MQTRANRNAVLALHPHFPERPLQMLHVGLPHPIQTMGLDQVHDSLEPRPNVARQGVERRLHAVIQNLHGP